MKFIPMHVSQVPLSEEDQKDLQAAAKELMAVARDSSLSKEERIEFVQQFSPKKKPRKPKAAKNTPAPLKGFLSSGILFIGDPSYMAGDLSQPGSELLESRENPFLNWDKFTQSLGDKDQSLPFPGAIEDNSSGRGVAVQTNRISGRFEIEKEYDKAGKLLQLVVKFYE